MNILITNDDGIESEGIKILARWAAKLGNVTIVAPKVEQSGRSHSIEIHKAYEVKPFCFENNLEAFSVDSTPADCIRIGVVALDRKYDLVLAGINKGLNIGEDIGYSGTCGAIFEAAYNNVPSIAFSTEPGSFKEAENQLDNCYNFIMENKLFDVCKIYNVNIPFNSKGIRLTHMGGPYFRDKYTSPEKNMYKPNGYSAYQGTKDFDCDVDAALNGFISISPMTVNRTDFEAYRILKEKFN